ncbi:GNAT family N-acetyltransferase [Thalassotalea sp. PS06]|uniref:GNAT family N-acetyltransferase n=1 Tax=Thalassotalea sp. PS06 TaxID=2594005 RepID=UPI001165AE45|nr:GNAT family N-acetyltransferase [Thalassotalea sp. PS06]QDP00969.1 GNAT family N-acetyltransferase [Thalassotalea sp. PS06]
MTSLAIEYQAKHFNELSAAELYQALKLRVDVFVVEQTCYYPELDNKDIDAEVLHLFAFDNNGTANELGLKPLAAYLRILPPGLCYPGMVAIGRVATDMDYRGKGLGHPLMREALRLCQQYWPDFSVKISAQEHLEAFYNKHGFTRISDMYLEDGIPHIEMLKD